MLSIDFNELIGNFQSPMSTPGKPKLSFSGEKATHVGVGP